MALPQITWQDVQQMPDDSNRYEAIDGDLYVTPAPSVRHQRISLRLERALYVLLVEAGHGELRHAPVGVEFPATGEGVQPDILFVSNERQGVAEYWIVDPDECAIDVWRFGGEPRHERFVDRLPVRLGDEPRGEIDLTAVFQD